MKKNNFDVDVDNPGSPVEINPILAHSKIAQVYQYRPPYDPAFFRRASEKMGVMNCAHLLDLCCGRGELAIGFSSYANHITGIDGSEEILSQAIKHPKISYQLVDVNQEPFSLGCRVDHILIGSAIHWISGASLARIIKDHLRPTGRILISHTLLKTEGEDYALALHEINHKYGKESRSVDLWGRDKVDACGLIRIDGLRIAKRVSVSVEWLYKNQLSYAYGRFYDQITAKPQDYERDFMNTLSRFSSHDTEGQLGGTLVNWGEIYVPK